MERALEERANATETGLIGGSAGRIPSPVKSIGAHDVRRPGDHAPAATAKPGYTVVKQKKSRWGEVRAADNELVFLTVYRKGAREVVRRLAA